MAMTLGAFPAEYDASITTRIAEEFAADPMTFLQYCAVDDDPRAVIKYTNYSGFADVPQWKDGEPIPVDEALKIGDQTLTMLFYGMGFPVTRQHVRYGELRLINQWASSLGRSAAQTMGVAGATLLNSAFSTTHTHFGTKTLCSTTHTTAGAGTRANRPTTDTALTPSTWEALCVLAMNWVNYRGLNDPWTPDLMIVPPALRSIGAKILGSTLEPSNTDNDMNVHKGMAQLVVEPRLSSTTAHFGMARGRAELQFIYGQRPRMISYMTPGEESIVKGIAFDFVTGIGKPDFVVGTDGTP